MPIADSQLPIEKQPFAPNEKRMLTLRAEVIDPKYIIDGKPPSIEAEHKRTERHPTHESRYYEIQGLGIRDLGIGKNKNSQVPIFMQLNHGNPADDEARLTAIAEDFLSLQPIADSLQPNGGEK